MVAVLTVLSFIMIAVYTSAVCIRLKAVPNSISETFYRIEHKTWFGITMISASLVLTPAILQVTPDSFQFTAFLACFGMCLTGIAPNFREGIEEKIHVSGAVLCLLFSQIWVYIINPWMLVLWVIYISYTAVCMKRKWDGKFISSFMKTKPMFWVETTSIVSTYSTLFLMMLK